MGFLHSFAWEKEDRLAREITPQTRVLGDEENISLAEMDRRKWASPLLFAFPSQVGYSGVLQEEDNRIEITFVQAVQKEHFFSPDWSEHDTADRSETNRLDLLMHQMADFEPRYPRTPLRAKNKRMMLSKPLGERLLEPPLFPNVLSTLEHGKWHTRAFLQISALGFVEHLFRAPARLDDDEPLVVAHAIWTAL